MGKGYVAVGLYDGDEKRKEYVHRLVATAFVRNPEEKPQVNHLNCDRTDNRAINLEWVSALENIHHGMEHGRVNAERFDSPQSVLSRAQALQIRRRLSRGETQRAVAKDYGVSQGTVSRVMQWL